MGELPPGAPPSERSTEARLDSWKEIAAYLKRDVTTAQRWEKREGMPVYRHLHDRMGSVYASRAELDAWMRSRDHRLAEESGHGAVGTDAPVPQSPLQTLTVSGGWKLGLLLILAIVALATGIGLWRKRSLWRNPIADARFQMVTDSNGQEQAAAISRDGNFVAFLSDRGGQTDVWVTQVGSGEFHNLTRGRFAELPNPSIRTLGFSPDESLVTFWLRKPRASGGGIGVWAVPILGGEPRPYLDGIGEFDWSREGSRLVYHTPGPGDPLFVSDGSIRAENRPIFTAPPGLHSHFPLWAPDGSFVYFVQGTLPDKLDIWRIQPEGGPPERITSHSSRVSYPVLLDRTLAYLASDPDGSGPWLYGMDVERRIPRRLTSGVDRYTSLAASANGRRLVATLATPNRTLWRMRIVEASGDSSAFSSGRVDSIPLTTGAGFYPRLGPDYLLYASATGTGQSIWKLADGTSTELWRGDGARVLGGPAISPDRATIAFSVQQRERTLLYTMSVDGTNARIAADSLDLVGAPSWSPDGRSLTLAANDHGLPHLFRVPLDGEPPAPFVREYSVDPVWSPDGKFVVYSGADIGTMFSVKAVNADGSAHAIPPLALTRGARRLAFLPGGPSLVFLRGELEHKNLWLINLETDVERKLADLPNDFDIRDFDLSPNGSEVVFERIQERSNVVLIDIPRR